MNTLFEKFVLTNVLVIASQSALLLGLISSWSGSKGQIALLVMAIFLFTWCVCNLIFTDHS